MGHPHPPTGPIQPIDSNPVVVKDAKDRSWRTFKQNFFVDMGVILIPLAYTALSDARWTEDYWITTGSTLGKTVLLTIIAYVYRFLKAPKVPTTGAGNS